MVRPGITFRVFVSSTFQDFAAERDALQKRVWPRLRELCRKHGARFQAIDLRWGVSEEASREQQTMQIGMGMCAGQRGERARAVELFAAAADTDGVEDWVIAAAENNLGVMLIEEGRYAEAEVHLVSGFEANQRAGDRRGVAQSRCSLGELYYRLARLDEAELALDEAIADAEEMEDVQCLTQSQAWLRRVYCLRGQQLAQSVEMGRPDSTSISPDAVAIDRLARTEELLAFGDDDEVRALLTDLEAVGYDADADAACANAGAELLAVGLEAAVLRGQVDLAERLSGDLAPALDRAVDREVIAYAHWLIELQLDLSRALEARHDQTTPCQSCFDLRARALISAITDESHSS